jgi:glycosyltransferase involved in cell wall biosynthesis
MELLEHKKRIIIVTDNFLPRRDGVVSFLLEIIPRLKKEFSITIICPDSKEKVSLEGVNFIRIPLSKKKFADFQLAKFKPSKMVKAIKKADVVFAQTIGPIGGSGLFLAQTMKKKTVSFIHSIEWELVHKATDNKFIKRHSRPLAKRVAKFFYKRCNYLIVPSERVSEILNYQAKSLKDNVYKVLKSLRKESVSESHHYAQVLDYLRETAHCFTYMVKPAYEYFDNEHTPFIDEQINDLKRLNTEIVQFYTYILDVIENNKFKNGENLLLHTVSLMKVQGNFIQNA